MNSLQKLIDYLDKLERNDIYYKLDKIRDSILVEVVVPGQRWEIEFMYDETVVIEKFISDGEIYNEKELENLLKEF